jgi:hypothetical protein
MAMALKESGRDREVDYISAHGYEEPTNDRVEAIAVRTLFGAGRRMAPMSLDQIDDRPHHGCGQRDPAVACSLISIPADSTDEFRGADEALISTTSRTRPPPNPSIILNNTTRLAATTRLCALARLAQNGA